MIAREPGPEIIKICNQDLLKFPLSASLTNVVDQANWRGQKHHYTVTEEDMTMSSLCVWGKTSSKRPYRDFTRPIVY
jgi:hypothetical protein